MIELKAKPYLGRIYKRRWRGTNQFIILAVLPDTLTKMTKELLLLSSEVEKSPGFVEWASDFSNNDWQLKNICYDLENAEIKREKSPREEFEIEFYKLDFELEGVIRNATAIKTRMDKLAAKFTEL